MSLIHHQPGRKQTLHPAPTPPSLLSLYPAKQVFGLGLRPSRSNIMTYTSTNRKSCLLAKWILISPFVLVSRQLLRVQVASTALVPLLRACSADTCLVKPRLRRSAFVTEDLKRYTSKRYKLITDDLEETVPRTCLSTTFTRRSIIANTPRSGISSTDVQITP